MNELSDKTALVIGANRGIGRSIAVAFAKVGVDVAINYRSHEHEAQEVADVAVMLARNGYVTGQTINVNGGWYMS